MKKDIISKKTIVNKEKSPLKIDFKNSLHYILNASFLSILISPVIYSLIIPFVFFDFCVWFYQLICFPVYKLSRVKRSQYIIFDRGKLKYLNRIERLNCNYCAYANGVIAYSREVASLTEQYFCPIKHLGNSSSHHSRYNDFLDYGNSDMYREFLKKRDSVK